MQTFLPYPDYTKSASVLDRQRLGKQRVETLQILRTLCGESQGWKNHPAVKMWAGSELALFAYQIAIVVEWNARGYKDTCLDKSAELIRNHPWTKKSNTIPAWLGNEVLHASHRANLIRKNADHYGQFGWDEGPQEGYWWPN
jgi:hypothetical protein